MGNLKNLPSEILLDIITRLPTELILDCKLVCKPWRNLVSHHPSFSRLHLNQVNHSADSGKLTFFVSAYKHFYCFEYDESHDGSPIHSLRRFNLTLRFKDFYNVIGTCNGIVCLYGGLRNVYRICNPITREYVKLERSKTDCDSRYTNMLRGFGYLPATNEYKVVEFYKLKEEDASFIEVAVYTLGSGKGWRNVGGIKSGGVDVANCVFVKEALHWLDKEDKRVLVFDLTVEKFSEHISPPPLPPANVSHYDTIGEFCGNLYYSIRYYSLVSDIWLLKEKKMKEQLEEEPSGWSKVCSTVFGRQPLAFTKSGGVLCYDGTFLGIFDAVTETMQNLVDPMRILEVFPHKKTLLSLKELGEENIKVMKSAEIEETKSRALLTKQLASS